MRGFVCAALALAFAGAEPWNDCSASADGHIDLESFGPYPITVDRTDALHPTYRPADLTAADAWPGFVFMHGSGCDDRLNSPSLERWASHGFIVVAPMMGTEADCTRPANDVKCADQSYDGAPLKAGLAWLKQMNTEPTSALYGRVDTEKIAIGGWSMGGVSTIKALSTLPPGAVQAVVLDSPSIADYGMIYNYTRAEIASDYQKAREYTNGFAPWYMYTSTNDALLFATRRLYESYSEGPTIYAQYKTRYCLDKPPYLNTTIWELDWATVPGFKGHFCAGLLTMTGWTTTFLKMTLQQRSNSSSACHGMMWGDGAASIASDQHIDVAHRDAPSTSA